MTPAESATDLAEDELWALFLVVVLGSMLMTIMFALLRSEGAARAWLCLPMAGLGFMAGECIPLQLLAWHRLTGESISRPWWKIVVPSCTAGVVAALSAWL